MNLIKATEGFLLDFQASGHSAGTTKLYRLALANLARFLNNPEVHQVQPEDLKRFMLWLRTDYKPYRQGNNNRSLSESAIDNYWKAIRSFWGWAKDALGCTRPDEGLPRSKFQTPVIVPFREAEVKALLQACAYSKEYQNPQTTKTYRTRRPTADRDIALILLMLDTGLRASEIARLNVEHLDLDTGAVYVVPFGSGQKTKPRIAYVGKLTKRALWRYLASREDAQKDEPLFVTDEGKTLRRIKSGTCSGI